MTSSTGCSGLIAAASPRICAIASRIAARSTTQGTPVKSCRSTREGVNAISRSCRAWLFQRASASTSSRVTLRPSSQRSRFSRSTLCENGSCDSVVRPARSSESRRKYRYERPAARRVSSALKLFGWEFIGQAYFGIALRVAFDSQRSLAGEQAPERFGDERQAPRLQRQGAFEARAILRYLTDEPLEHRAGHEQARRQLLRSRDLADRGGEQ